MTGPPLPILANDRGAAIVELALVAPFFALMTVGIVDMSNAFSRKLALEQGAQRSIEKVMQTTELNTVQDTLKLEACVQIDGANDDGSCKGTPVAPNDISVTFRLECTNNAGTIAAQSTTDADLFDTYTCAAGTAKEAKYISVTVTNTFTPMFPIHFAGYDSARGGYDLSATAGVRTE